MTFYTHSFTEIIKSAFSAETWRLLFPALISTLYMVGIATILTLIVGLILGAILVMTDKDGLTPIPFLNRILGAVINALRSLPSMIMIILTLPLARLITGKGYGANACIIALAISCIPMYARLVENSLLEVDKGKIEAAKSMGIDNFKILFTLILPESLPSIVRSFTVAVIAIISMTALAGSFGAGGIGNIAIQYGFNRFRYDILIATVFVLIIFAQIVQMAGDFGAKLILKKRHLL
ncbi:methionine ABC transporter permease [Marinisporobacter balticus]|uniref:D-methionine transport system permease protein n=1 Tax=Marinisporobacter balticus TaxID=2018667 RepID=A0A4V2SA83_9FIRM|nr:methionine ABC transporter permease [Marinisporobacter balticus]TCO70650.1 D-methionine transport system permease protein [Marinisporobacter balticus]